MLADLLPLIALTSWTGAAVGGRVLRRRVRARRQEAARVTAWVLWLRWSSRLPERA